ncbi:hypothetical protein [Halobacillus sp. Cin3]|uniref:hypothetical protein n=1 Tax=Halobacillus sp. Cin3 TaxID=2928441 RepID=UPI00248EE119|nr:hypothetical protein [Halobacillus sp. Cin3]
MRAPVRFKQETCESDTYFKINRKNPVRNRAVFAKYKDNLGFHRYQFVGVYGLAGVSPDDSRFMGYERVSDRVEIGRR